MRRLIRPLTLVIGLLVALSGGAVVGVAANNRHPAGPARVQARSSDTAVPLSPGPTPEDLVPAPLAPAAVPTTVTAGGAAPTQPAAATPQSPLAKLTARLDAALAGSTSCLTVEDGRGQPLYQHQPDLALIPASTQKLLVAAAALTTLGPDFRFVTNVVAPGAPTGGKVDQLWLVGNGDPLLATAEFTATLTGGARVAGYPWTSFGTVADAVAAAGITSVPGGVHGDDSHLDRLRFLPVWPAFYQTQQEVGLLSALSLNEGIQTTTPKVTLAQDPPGFAASELTRLLAAHRVAVGPVGADQTAPANGAVVATVSSAPLSQIVEAMVRASDNWIAELLVRQMDRAAGGAGTTSGGVSVVLRQAAGLSIPLGGVRMDDGSGLSPTDRATCRELLAAIDLTAQPRFSPILTGLPIAALTGTLAGRFANTPIAGNLRAKTGSLVEDGGLVGLLSVRTQLHFALLVNRAGSEPALLAKEDRVVAALATYPE